jgi:hypothetical protein
LSLDRSNDDPRGSAFWSQYLWHAR